jgi:hypothetical protein
MRDTFCFACHSGAGVHSLDTYTQTFSDPKLQPRLIPQNDPSEIEQKTLRLNRSRYDFGSLEPSFYPTRNPPQ